MTESRIMPYLAVLVLFLMGCGAIANPTSPATPSPSTPRSASEPTRPAATPQAPVRPQAIPTLRAARQATDLPWPTVPPVVQPAAVPAATPPYTAEPGPTTLPPTPQPGPVPQVAPTKVAPTPTLTVRPTATPRPTPTATPIRTPTPTPSPVLAPTPTPNSTPQTRLTAGSTSFSPTTVVLATIGSSGTITVGTVGVLPGADGVQLNIQHPNIVTVTSPSCTGIFQGANGLGPTPVSGGTLMGCFLLTGNVSATTGNVMTFVVTRVGPGSAMLSFGLGGGFGTQFSDGGTSISPGVTNTLQIN